MLKRRRKRCTRRSRKLSRTAGTRTLAEASTSMETTGVTAGEETTVAMGVAVAEGGVGADGALLSRLQKTGRKSTANLAAPESRRTCR